MATFLISTPQTPNGVLIGSTGTFVYSPAATVFHNDGFAMQVTNGSQLRANVILHNTVVSGASTGVGVRLDGFDRLTIGLTGSVNTDSGIAVVLASDDNALRNAGTIVGSSGVSASGERSYVMNAGSIFSGFFGVSVSGANSDLVNSGSISAFQFGVLSVRGGDVVINSGTISGGNGSNFSAAGALFVGNFPDVENTLINNGTIIGVAGTGRDRGFAVVDNASVSFTTSTNAPSKLTVKNAGLLDGDVMLFAGDDVYKGIGTGLVNGVVDGGDGDDLLTGSSVDDVFEGGADRDTLRGRDGDDLLSGGSGVDDVHGGDGDDTLNGDGSSDKLRGGAGDDSIRGGGGLDDIHGGHDDDLLLGDSGDDTVAGGAGDDTIQGGSGDDLLLGGVDDDVLIGGRDKDILTGGPGEDIFVFLDRTDSRNDSTRDIITDFERGEDLIDLSALPGNLDFIGSNGFSGSDREVRVVSGGNAKVTVFVDSNGDGAADMRIVVEGVNNLGGNDFLL